ncbi:MAG: hypothetical protein H7Z72_11690 [Bacteroidetes bacterium]|nr:hypothetical protein [Fibrella sp.]
MRNQAVITRLFIIAAVGWLGFTLPAAQAQTRDSLSVIYDSQTIQSFGSIYVKGSRRLTFRALSSEFQPGVTKDLYEQSRKSLVLARIMTVVSVAALVGSAILRKNQQTGGVALLAVGVGLNLGNLGLRKKSTELVDRAIWQRNREILFNVR